MFLYYTVTVIHFVVAVSLIVVVLLQSQQSMNLSGMFGGASQSALGSKPQSVLAKATTVLAIIFMLTSLFLMLYSPTGQGGALNPNQASQSPSPAPAPQQGSPGSGGSGSPGGSPSPNS